MRVDQRRSSARVTRRATASDTQGLQDLLGGFGHIKELSKLEEGPDMGINCKPSFQMMKRVELT